MRTEGFAHPSSGSPLDAQHASGVDCGRIGHLQIASRAPTGEPGRPAVPKDIRELIRRLSRENPLWGAPRIHGELLKLGIDIGETSVGKYLGRHRKPPSQTWRTFLENHVQSMVSVDFFTLPTITFQVLYVFLVLAHDRRRIVHFNVTAHPTAEWTGQQLREAFPFEQMPRYLLRDRDGMFGREFRRDVEAMGIKEALSTPRSPWERAFVERVIGTIRRECLDHVIAFSEASLYRHVKSFLAYYHGPGRTCHWARTRRNRGRCNRPNAEPLSPFAKLAGFITGMSGAPLKLCAPRRRSCHANNSAQFGNCLKDRSHPTRHTHADSR